MMDSLPADSRMSPADSRMSPVDNITDNRDKIVSPAAEYSDLSHEKIDHSDSKEFQQDEEEHLPVLTDSVGAEQTDSSENIESEKGDLITDIKQESNTVVEDDDKKLNDSEKNDTEDKESEKGDIIEDSFHGDSNHGESKVDLEDIDKGADFSDVQVKVIEVPDDDDLFDFLKEKNEEKEEDLKKTELYKYLTEESQLHHQSEEVTPYPSGDEHEDAGSNRSSSSGDDESSSGSSSSGDEDEFESQEMLEGETLSERIAKEAQMEKEYKEMESQMKKKLEKKPSLKTPQSKTTSIQSQQAQLSKITMERLEKSKEITKQWLKDLDIPENLKFSQPIQMKMSDLNQYLTCGLCKGYLYEASTITECMHTFCKNCIVRHCMEVSLHCPVCSILIHPTDPFVNIRLDRMIQDIVYKILPNVADTEMKRIEEFYEAHPEVEQKVIQLPPPKPKTTPKENKEPEPVYTPSPLVSIVLESEEQYPDQEVLEKKFVRVSSMATVGSVCDFLKKKLSLQEKQAVELFCCGDAMEESQCTLETIKHNFFGDQEDLMLLQYRIRET